MNTRRHYQHVYTPEQEQQHREHELSPDELAAEMPEAWELPDEPEHLHITPDRLSLVYVLPDQSQRAVCLDEMPPDGVLCELRRVMQPDGTVTIGRQQMAAAELPTRAPTLRARVPMRLGKQFAANTLNVTNARERIAELKRLGTTQDDIAFITRCGRDSVAKVLRPNGR